MTAKSVLTSPIEFFTSTERRYYRTWWTRTSKRCWHDAKRNMIIIFNSNHALQRQLCIRWTTSASGISCKPNGLQRICSVSAPPHRIVQGYQLWTRIRHDRLTRYPKAVLINGLTRAAEEQRPKMKFNYNARRNIHTNYANEALIKRRRRIYAVKKIVDYEERPTVTYYTVRVYGYELQGHTVKPCAHTLHHFWEAYWQEVQKIAKDIGLK